MRNLTGLVNKELILMAKNRERYKGTVLAVNYIGKNDRTYPVYAFMCFNGQAVKISGQRGSHSRVTPLREKDGRGHTKGLFLKNYSSIESIEFLPRTEFEVPIRMY